MKAVALQVPPGHPWLDLVSGWTVMGCCSLEFSKIPPEPAQADLQWAQPTLRGRELRTCHQFVVPASFASPVPLGGGGGGASEGSRVGPADSRGNGKARPSPGGPMVSASSAAALYWSCDLWASPGFPLSLSPGLPEPKLLSPTYR